MGVVFLAQSEGPEPAVSDALSPILLVQSMEHLVPNHAHTVEEYLEIEETSTVRHEFYEGEIYAMAGGTPEHAAIAAEITAKLGQQLEGGPCRVYSAGLRVRILSTGLATYPDVTVICGPSKRDQPAQVMSRTPRWWSKC